MKNIDKEILTFKYTIKLDESDENNLFHEDKRYFKCLYKNKPVVTDNSVIEFYTQEYLTIEKFVELCKPLGRYTIIEGIFETSYKDGEFKND